MTLYTLVYVSLATHPMTDDELRDLLEISRDNNARLDITGMLLYRDGFFIQALEGQEQAVEDLFTKISKDPRHTNVLVVHRGNISREGRTFAEWAMGFNKIKLDEAKQIPGFTDFLQQPGDGRFFSNNPERAQKLLKSFKDRTFF